MFSSIIFRVVFSYYLLLFFVRLSKKRTLYQGTPLDFVVVLLIGDMIDNAIWHDVSLLHFITAVSVIFITHVLNKILAYYLFTSSEKNLQKSDLP